MGGMFSSGGAKASVQRMAKDQQFAEAMQIAVGARREKRRLAEVNRRVGAINERFEGPEVERLLGVARSSTANLFAAGAEDRYGSSLRGIKLRLSRTGNLGGGVEQQARQSATVGLAAGRAGAVQQGAAAGRQLGTQLEDTRRHLVSLARGTPPPPISSGYQVPGAMQAAADQIPAAMLDEMGNIWMQHNIDLATAYDAHSQYTQRKGTA